MTGLITSTDSVPDNHLYALAMNWALLQLSSLTDEETEAQREKAACLRSDWYVLRLNLDPGHMIHQYKHAYFSVC